MASREGNVSVQSVPRGRWQQGANATSQSSSKVRSLQAALAALGPEAEIGLALKRVREQATAQVVFRSRGQNGSWARQSGQVGTSDCSHGGFEGPSNERVGDSVETGATRSTGDAFGNTDSGQGSFPREGTEEAGLSILNFFLLARKKSITGVFSASVFCIPRKPNCDGPQRMDSFGCAPKWIQVLRGPCPKSVQWPSAKEAIRQTQCSHVVGGRFRRPATGMWTRRGSLSAHSHA